MAQTVYFRDGTHEVIFCRPDDTEGRKIVLERILREKLGEDTVSLLNDVLDPELNGIDALEWELKSYEGSCESYRACLGDVYDGLNEMVKLLRENRLNRKKLTELTDKLRKQIHSEL